MRTVREGPVAVGRGTEVLAVMEIFEHLAPNLSTAIELEITQSKAAVDACHRAGIKHIVYSAMDDLPEGVTVPPAVSKAEGAPWFTR